MGDGLKFIPLLLLLIFSAVQTLRARTLILSTCWLAGVSVMTSIILYELLAQHVAVIELSVGAGLVTVLFVFAISSVGDQAVEWRALVPRAISFGLVLGSILLIFVLQGSDRGVFFYLIDEGLADGFWQVRGLDLVVQVVLIFSGVLGLVGILADSKAPLQYPMADEVAASRDEDLDRMAEQFQSVLKVSGDSVPAAGSMGSVQGGAPEGQD
jgi:uncharacterized MnhB-related membrane protein